MHCDFQIKALGISHTDSSYTVHLHIFAQMWSHTVPHRFFECTTRDHRTNATNATVKPKQYIEKEQNATAKQILKLSLHNSWMVLLLLCWAVHTHCLSVAGLLSFIKMFFALSRFVSHFRVHIIKLPYWNALNIMWWRWRENGWQCSSIGVSEEEGASRTRKESKPFMLNEKYKLNE